jgi:hypothetical protein
MYCYVCEYCNYKTNVNSNFHKHLKTRKHLNKISLKGTDTKNIAILINNEDSTKNDQKMVKMVKMTKNDQKMTKNDQKMTINDKKYSCEECKKKYTSLAHLKRHQANYCSKKKPINQHSLLSIIQKQSETIEEIVKEHEKERKELYSKMDKLLEHVGDTTNNITNNKIILNCYGNEDMSHITDAFKAGLLKVPYVMIPKMIEEVHFNKPENKNIYVPNKKQPLIKVYADNKWIFKDKKSTINELINKNFNILDNYYEDGGKKTLDNTQQRRYDEFCDKIQQDTDTKDNILKETDLVIINHN